MAKLAIAPPTHSLLDLPDEVLIICFELMGVEDVLNLRCGCQRFKQLIDETPSIWRNLLKSNYSVSYFSLELKNPDSWKSILMTRHHIQKTVIDVVKDLSIQYFHKNNLSRIHAQEFVNKINAGDNKPFIIDSLSLILDSHQDRQLTDKYYAGKLLYYLRTERLEGFWKELKSGRYRDDEPFDYMQGLVNIAQWFQSQENISLERVRHDVTCIATRTLENLHLKKPNHPIFQQVENKNSQNINRFLFKQTPPDPPFNLKECQNILTTLNETFFGEFGFLGNTSDYNNPQNSYVNCVLQTKQGIPITLCLIYSAVAAKLGLVLLPVNNPGHFLLCWTYRDGQSFLIDCFKSGSQSEVDKVTNFATPLQVFQRMVRNLVYVWDPRQDFPDLDPGQSPLSLPSLELSRLLNEEEDGFVADYNLCVLYLQLNINHREILEIMDSGSLSDLNARVEMRLPVRQLEMAALQLMERDQEEEQERIAEEPKMRSHIEMNHSDQEVEQFGKYAVGMVMKHRLYNYTCVVYGWDPTCGASQAWVKRMGVDQLPLKDKQPFYNVLVEDTSMRYAADENLYPCKPQRINHHLIGKYFMEFDEGLGYIPNNELAKKYPEDEAVQLKFKGSWKNIKDQSS